MMSLNRITSYLLITASRREKHLGCSSLLFPPGELPLSDFG